MARTSSDKPTSTLQLIAIPAVITLAITILRLIGEMQGWSTLWFNPAPGGGGGLIGIVWLVPIFGIYFAVKLSVAGEGPVSAGRPALIALLGIVVVVAGFVVAFKVSQPGLLGAQAAVGLAAIIATALQYRAWPVLFKTLLAYGFAARIPVTIIMFFAIRGNWGTHYDGPPPGFPEDISWFPKFILIGVLPQLVFWIAFTVLVGTLFGGIAVAIPRWRELAKEAAVVAYGILGLLILGFVGFLLRPSAPIIGQLPFDDVISRGASLKGINQVLVPTAQTSFNYMLAGALVGAAIGVATGYFLSKRRA